MEARLCISKSTFELKMEASTANSATVQSRGWWTRRLRKPGREIALDLTLFVLGVVILYAIDLTVISRSMPIAFQYVIDLVLYLNHQAVAAVEMLY
jgi:hypothetical protein